MFKKDWDARTESVATAYFDIRRRIQIGNGQCEHCGRDVSCVPIPEIGIVPLPQANHLHRDSPHDELDELHSLLEQAQKHIERRFADFGAIVIDLIGQSGKLKQIVADIRAGVDGDGAPIESMKAAFEDADRYVGALQAQRQLASGASQTNKVLAAVATNMDASLRYMRMCAITVKITGARTAEIVGFADDMLESVVNCGDRLAHFHQSLSRVAAAIDRGDVGDGHSREDQVMAQLNGSVQAALVAIRSRQANLRLSTMTTAGQLLKFETALAQCLSGLQGGDIAGQRIGHVRDAIELLSSAQSSGEVGADMFRRLLVDQLSDLISELNEQTAQFGQGMDICKRIAADLDQMKDETGRIDLPANRSLASTFQAATRDAVNTIVSADETSRRLADAGEAGLQAIAEQRKNIESIRIANTGVLYMALNTNLRCSRLGVEARSANSITGELRATSAQLSTSTDQISSGLDELDRLADGLIGQRLPEVETIRAQWESAVSGFQQMDASTDENCAGLQDYCTFIGDNVVQVAAGEDFQKEFSRLLLDCLLRLQSAAVPSAPFSEVPSQNVQDFGDRVFQSYTMNRERDIHRKYFSVPEEIADCDSVNIWGVPETAESAPAIMLF